MTASIICTGVELLFTLPQIVFDFFFGLIGLPSPDLTLAIGSIFGCNLP